MHVAGKFRVVKFAVFTDLSLPAKILICETIVMSFLIRIESESAKT